MANFLNIFALLVKQMFCQNYWGWFHILAGAVMAKTMILFPLPGILTRYPLITILIIAITWEVYEYFSSDVLKIYGSYRRFYYDAAGDIVGTMLAAAIVVL